MSFFIYRSSASYTKPCEAEWRMYVSVNKATIGSKNSLSPYRRQDIIWNNAVFLLFGLLETNGSEIFIQNWSEAFFMKEGEFARWRLQNGDYFV